MSAFPIAKNKRRQEGFTLIATLLVVSLLTVLLVAAIVLSQIEQQASYNASRVEVARQNALFGLNQALNQLQTTAGPDRRVTARADILNSVNAGTAEGYKPTTSDSTPATDSGQSFWTGVWKTTSNDYSGCAGNGLSSPTNNPDPAIAQNPGPAGSFFYFDYTPDGNPKLPAAGTLTASNALLNPTVAPSRAQLYDNVNVNWLISWPYSAALTNRPDPSASLASQIPSIQIPTLAGNYTLTGSSCLVNLANNLNITTTVNPNLAASSVTSVSAPKVPIVEASPLGKGIAIGTYAYWVSDEGIKAKSDIPDPYIGTTPGSSGAPNGVSISQAHFAIAQSNDCSQALNLNNLNNCFGSASSAADLRSLSFLAPSLSSMAYADSHQTWLSFGSNPNAYSPDFTVSSYGLLADNYNGGLRQDLTAALENNLIFQNRFSDGAGNEDARKLYGLDAIYQSNVVPDIQSKPWTATNVGTIIDGMRWSSLYYYYNIYHTTMQSPLAANNVANPNAGVGSQFASECNGTSPTMTGRIYTEPNPGPSGGYLEIDGLFPTLMYWNYSYGLDVNMTQGDDVNGYHYDFISSCSPVMIYYNPYDVSLSAPSKSYNVLAGALVSQTNLTATPIEIDKSGVAFWGPYPVSFPDPNFQTEVETQPYTAGESRVYYLNKNWVAQNPMVSTTIPAPATAITYNFTSYPGPTPTLPPSPNLLPKDVTQFNVKSTAPPGNSAGTAGNRLVPIGTGSDFSADRDQQEEFTPNPPIFVQDTAANLDKGIYKAVISGTQLFDAKGLALTRFNYDQWPIPASAQITTYGIPDSFYAPNFTSTTGTGSEGFVTLGPDSSKPSGRDINFGSGSVGDIVSEEYHAPGTASTLFTFSGIGYAFQKQNVSPSVNIGLPCLAAGGAAFNPLNGDYNDYAADWSGTGKFSSRYDPSVDISNSEFPNAGGTGMSESTWFPNSAGKDSNKRQVILHDLPRGPLLSIGQFKNMNCRYYAVGANYSTVTGLGVTTQSYATDFCNTLGFSNYPVGGSYPSGLNTNCAIQLQMILICAAPMTITETDATAAGGYGMPKNSVMQDDNFMANNVLFDSYFLSTVPPLSVPDGANWPVDATQFKTQSAGQAYLDANKPLPNSRLVYYRRSQSATLPFRGNPPTSGTSSPNINDLQCANAKTANLRKPAANLLVNGAFNVNSTSATAWTALLTSTAASNNVMALLSPQPNGTSTTVTNHNFPPSETPFLNFNLALGSSAWTGTVNNNMGLFGMVDLSTATVQALASRIVNQVQMRGPFLSLGDFLNHRLRPVPTNSKGAPNLGSFPNQDAYSASGALQYAIDDWPSMTWPPTTYTPPDAINKSLGGDPSVGMPVSTAHDTTNSKYYGYYFYSATPPVLPNYNRSILPDVPYQTGIGVPGTLMQNDLVQAIAPVIADRSDTFKIRVYGQALSPIGSSEAEVYGEAVVQRLPEYIYSAENATLEATTGGGSGAGNYAYDNPSQSTLNGTINGTTVYGLTKGNSAFGRRFKVISFRWLNKNEI